jgi:ribosomal protein S27AE
MGKMKELYIKMLEERYTGDPSEYLKDYANKIYEGFSLTNILCPNCMKEKLAQDSETDLTCFKCGYDFIKINENSVKFK